MPELKRIFQAGRMNRTFDDRLVPNGEYQEALNVNVGRSESNDVGALENVLGNAEISNDDLITDAVCIGIHRDNQSDKIFIFVTNNDDPYEKNTGDHAVYEYDQTTSTLSTLIKTEYDSEDDEANWLNFHTSYLITGINYVDDLLFWTDNRNEPRKINVTRARNDVNHYLDENSTVIKIHPTGEMTFVIRTDFDSGYSSRFLEDKFPRFAYRYKFEDGEYSPISTWSQWFFDARDVGQGGGLYQIERIEDIGTVDGLINAMRGIDLTTHIPIGHGITEVEWLYNDTSTTNIYSIGTSEPDTLGETNFKYYGEEPFKVLPESQATRIYDNVPRKAQSQEFVGGRIVYGNYLQNYDLPELDYTVSVVERTLDTDGADNTQTRRSLKTRRNYTVGVILEDKYGRQTPVITSSSGGSTIYCNPFTGTNGGVNKRLRITFDSDQTLPDWVEHIRLAVKPDRGAYYNWFYKGAADTDGAAGIDIVDRNLNKVPRDATEGATYSGSNVLLPSNAKMWRIMENDGSASDTTMRLVSSADGIKQQRVLNILEDTDSSTKKYPEAITDFSLGSGSDFRGVLEIVPDEDILDVYYEAENIQNASQFEVDGKAYDVKFYNCYLIDYRVSNSVIFPLEINRIESDFNAPSINNGIKAFVPKEDFAEERRFNTLIHSSGLFNSRVGINASNEFNEAEGGLTVSLDPSDGSIQKLFAEDTQLIIFQEDKVSRSPIDKDFIYTAEGGSIPVTTNTQFLGTIAPYVGEYGISRNPESFAVYGNRKYFTDRNRGVVLRLSNDGLTEISNYGMVDFFRDTLAKADSIIGSYDEYHDLYNLTISADAPSFTGFEDTNIATAPDGYFTVSFDEQVQGWPSFKSFEQEQGITLNNRYYTINGGRLWEHNTGDVYNTFYGRSADSYVDIVFNDNPSTVKDFKTCGFEGDENWRLDYVETDFEEYFADGVDLSEEDVVTTTLSVSVSHRNSIVRGAKPITVRYDAENPETLTWYLKVEPTFSTDVISSVNEVDITGDGTVSDEEVIDGSLWFTYTLTSPPNDSTHTLTIETA